MTMLYLYSFAAIFIISLVSLVGAFTLGIKEQILRKYILFIIAFSAGAMIGDVFIHLLPELVEEGFDLSVSIYILVGIVATFILEKIIHTRHEHLYKDKHKAHAVSMMSLVGDSMHNFVDGIVVGATFLISIPAGIATSIAVIFHEIPQEIGNFGVLLHGGISKGRALFYNFLSALTAFLGLILALYLKNTSEAVTHALVPFAIGNFIYVAASDLIPELHKDSNIKSTLGQLFFLILGILIMTSLLYLE